MIGGDDVARSAFRVSLREQPSSPSLATQELDPSDILEVHDVAEAIARAEALVRTPVPRSRPSLDLFEELGRRRPTDDAVGPATPATGRISTVPPPPRTAELAATTTTTNALPAIAPVLHVPTFMPPAMGGSGSPEDDAYFHPGGRIRGFGEMTLDGYRPEATLLVRLRQRRTRFTWWIAGALVLLAAFATAAVVTPAGDDPVVKTGDRAARRPDGARGVVFASSGAKARAAGAPSPTALGAIPVLDVRTLPRAR